MNIFAPFSFVFRYSNLLRSHPNVFIVLSIFVFGSLHNLVMSSSVSEPLISLCFHRMWLNEVALIGIFLMLGFVQSLDWKFSVLGIRMKCLVFLVSSLNAKI